MLSDINDSTIHCTLTVLVDVPRFHSLAVTALPVGHVYDLAVTELVSHGELAGIVAAYIPSGARFVEAFSSVQHGGELDEETLRFLLVV